MRLVVLLFVLAGLTLVPGAAASVPSFGAPLGARAGSARGVGEPAVAVGAGERSAVAFDESGSGVVVRRGTLRRPLGPREVLTRRGSQPGVAVSGTATAVVWQGSGTGGRRYVAVRVARGRRAFGPVQTLARVTANVTSQSVVALGANRFVAIWWQGEPRTGRHVIRYAVSSSAGRFSATRELVADTGPSTGVSAGREADGSVTAAWGTPLSASPPRNQQLASATLAAGGFRFGPPAHIDAVQPGAETVSIRVQSGPGGAALSWTEDAALPELLRSRLPGGAPETVVSLDDSTDLGKRFVEGPALALPRAGGAVAAWAVVDATGGESERVTGGRVFAAPHTPDGGDAPAIQLSRAGDVATAPGAQATRSLAIVTWATGEFPRYGLHYAIRGADGSFAPERTLTRAAQRPVTLASSAEGALAAWVDRQGLGSRRDPFVGGTLKVAVLREG